MKKRTHVGSFFCILQKSDFFAQIDTHLNSKDMAVRVAAVIASSSLGSTKGKETLDELIKTKVISPDWVD